MNNQKSEKKGRLNAIVRPDEEQMCCLKCGYILPEDKGYEIEQPDGSSGEEFPICPNCDNWNCGGYPSFAEWYLWGEDARNIILFGEA